MKSILLGAGLSKRMGCQKLLLPLGEKNVIQTVIENLHRAGFEKIYAVLSSEVAEALANLPDYVKAEINPNPERGQSSSLAIALEMIPEGEDFCIMLADLPLTTSENIACLTEKFKNLPADKSVLAPCKDGIFGHPIYYRAIWRSRFKEAKGDVGGRKILMNYDSEIERVAVPNCHFKDMDTPEDYEALTQNRGRP